MDISSEMVKSLRDRTGAGMMDCKKALAESNGDMDKAIDYLRKKGAATAEKRADRAANQGVIEAYIHAGGRIGAMVELNCETDFVAKTEDFKALAREITMQIAAMNPLYIAREDVTKETIDHEMEIYKQQAHNEKKPEQVVQRIAEGKLEKYYQEFNATAAFAVASLLALLALFTLLIKTWLEWKTHQKYEAALRTKSP